MNLHDRPTAQELVAAVREYLLEEVATIPDQRAHFRALIAANVLAIVERELESELTAAQSHPDDRAELCAAIRAERYDDPKSFAQILERVRGLVERKLAVSNPRFLEAAMESDENW